MNQRQHSRHKSQVPESELLRQLRSPNVKQIGNYTLGKTIGEGTYGKVKLATHNLLGNQVAVKIVDKIHAATLAREIDAWRQLKHPNIAQLYEGVMTETKIYMVTEYASQGEIFDYVTNKGPLTVTNDDGSPGEAKVLFHQLVSALKYCHDMKFVHRDLKLENIMLDHHFNIKLIDFGFTREVDTKNKLLDTYCGSVAYSAPEILLGQKYSGTLADCWSLGVILYTLVCGYLPFDDENDNKVQAKIMSLEYDLPSALDATSKDLITRILQLDPSKRVSIDMMLKHKWFDGMNSSLAMNGSPIPKLTLENSLGTMSVDDMDVSSSDVKNPDVKFVSNLGENEIKTLYGFHMAGFQIRDMVKSIRVDSCDSLSAMYYLRLCSENEYQTDISLGDMKDKIISQIKQAAQSVAYNYQPSPTISSPALSSTKGSPKVKRRDPTRQSSNRSLKSTPLQYSESTQSITTAAESPLQKSARPKSAATPVSQTPLRRDFAASAQLGSAASKNRPYSPASSSQSPNSSQLFAAFASNTRRGSLKWAKQVDVDMVPVSADKNVEQWDNLLPSPLADRRGSKRQATITEDAEEEEVDEEGQGNDKPVVSPPPQTSPQKVKEQTAARKETRRSKSKLNLKNLFRSDRPQSIPETASIGFDIDDVLRNVDDFTLEETYTDEFVTRKVTTTAPEVLIKSKKSSRSSSLASINESKSEEEQEDEIERSREKLRSGLAYENETTSASARSSYKILATTSSITSVEERRDGQQQIVISAKSSSKTTIENQVQK
ncbi:hypothetical protein MP228_012935 [Amoeboaphelidium protococcarum]|nr:hypothetical protein MP228_012935 [Amoeboaphelidium protococcarum]